MNATTGIRNHDKERNIDTTTGTTKSSTHDIIAGSSSSIQRKELHIAPMLHVSTIEFRTLMRILTKYATIWTEMIVDETIYFQCLRQQQQQQQQLQGDCSDILPQRQMELTIPPEILYPTTTTTERYHHHHHPIVCQLGTINPIWTSIATQCILRTIYNNRNSNSCCSGSSNTCSSNEININLDCPSTRVQGKEFGAVLMQDVTKVIAFVQSIQAHLPSDMCVSIKCRIGMILDRDTDDNDIDDTNCISKNGDTDNNVTTTDYDWIAHFIQEISVVCTRFILHARPVILHGLKNRSCCSSSATTTSSSNISPAQNRSIPPLNYMWVYQLCHQFPQCTFILNGGITNLDMAKSICYGVSFPPCPPDDVLQQQRQSSSSSSSPSSPHPTFSSSDDDYYNDHGSVPCKKCQQLYPGIAKYGSCIVPPSINNNNSFRAPHNLRGCMMGRAAMDHPIQFAKVDSMWYNIIDDDEDDTDVVGTKHPRARTRRMVLQQYCLFLDTLYPRRCCDGDTRITSEIPSPTVVFHSPFCHICQEFRQSSFVVRCETDNIDKRFKTTSCRRQTSDTENSVMDVVVVSPDHQPKRLVDINTKITDVGTTKQPTTKKIATRIIDRCIKPILNIFHGCSGSKSFKYTCELLRRDSTIRDCGPAYIIYHAIQVSNISDDVFDECIV